MRRCGKCKTEKPFSEFHKDKRLSCGLKTECKSCRAAYVKLRRQSSVEVHRKILEQGRRYARNNPYKRKDAMYRREYGITYEEFKALVSTREGRCDLCERVPTQTLVVDHEHATGKIRGLLCRSCNGALGVFGDDEVGLLKALKYVRM